MVAAFVSVLLANVDAVPHGVEVLRIVEKEAGGAARRRRAGDGLRLVWGAPRARNPVRRLWKRAQNCICVEALLSTIGVCCGQG